MLRERIIPVLLMRNKGLVKGIQFNKYRYIGDPINAIKIFNDKEVDELALLDIDATLDNKTIETTFVQKVADECYMPFLVGGGISSVNQIRNLLKAGAEKVSLNTEAIRNPKLIIDAAEVFGSQSIVVSIDVNKNWFGKRVVVSHSGTKKTNLDPFEWAKQVEELGAGEILINCVYQDGKMDGYDLQFAKEISSLINIPVVFSGGAGNYDDIKELFIQTSVSAAAAGSLFVFHGRKKAVLISHPSQSERRAIIE